MGGSLLHDEKAATASIGRLSLKSRLSHAGVKDGLLTWCVQVLDHLLETYVTDNSITKAKSKKVRLTQPANRCHYNTPMPDVGRHCVSHRCAVRA